jgi:SOS-response transcriptional repressor LexA
MLPTASDLNDRFAERLRFWRSSQNMTQADAARLLDIDRSYLSQVERGRSPGNALRARFFVVEKASPAPSHGLAISTAGLRNLPVLSWAQAGDITDFGSTVMQEWNDVVPSDVGDERAFGVRLRGDSMEPKFSEGDIAILLPGTAPTNGEIVVVNLKNQGVSCKIMHVQLDKNLVKLSSYNPAYPPTEYHRKEFHWVYPVGSIVKQLRRR